MKKAIFLTIVLLLHCVSRGQSIKERAEKGDAEGQLKLGVMYYSGEGIPKDEAEAVKWLRKAADQGYADAQSYLGAMYADGKGVPKDNVLAYMWLNLSDATGREDAKKTMELVSGRMSQEQIAEAQKLSRDWKPVKAAKP